MTAREQARELLIEYSRQLGVDLCFQNFARELATFPGDYAPPGGCFLLAMDSRIAAGCVALRALDDGICELKRLYVRGPYRGTGLGRRLTEAAIAKARSLNYSAIRLDTLPFMREAMALYRSLGFREITPYRNYESQDLLFFELPLTGRPVSEPARDDSSSSPREAALRQAT